MKLASAGLVLALAAAAQHNPVLPGDYPDPSVIRVGKEYWATATTSHWAPIFPLLRSTDLKNWTHVGAVSKGPTGPRSTFGLPKLPNTRVGTSSTTPPRRRMARSASHLLQRRNPLARTPITAL